MLRLTLLYHSNINKDKLIVVDGYCGKECRFSSEMQLWFGCSCYIDGPTLAMDELVALN